MSDTERLDGLDAGMRRVAMVSQILAVECTEDREGNGELVFMVGASLGTSLREAIDNYLAGKAAGDG